MCSHLVEELLKRRYKVIIFDDLSTGKLENIRPLIEPSWHSVPLLFCHCEQSVAISIAPTELASADFASLAMTRRMCHSERSEESPLRSGLS